MKSEIETFRASIRKAIVDKDRVALEGFLANDFVHTHGSGKVDDKAARITGMLGATATIDSAPADDLRIRIPVPGTGIVTGVSKVPMGPQEVTFRWTAIYVKKGQSWQFAASQATRLSA